MDRHQLNQRDRHGKRLSSSRATDYGGSPTRDDQDIWNTMSVPSSPIAHNFFQPTPEFHYNPPLPQTVQTPSDWYRIPETPELHNFGIEAGGNTSHGTTPMSAFWNTHAQHEHSRTAGSSSHYDLLSQFTSGMQLTGSTPSQRHYTVEPQDVESAIQGYRRPTENELNSRNPRYNTYPWQRNLKEKHLKDIYRKIGAYWGKISRSSLDARFAILNTKLNGNDGMIKAILEGKQTVIERLGNEFASSITRPIRATSRARMTVEEYLNNSDIYFSKRKPQLQTTIMEEPTPDDEGHERPSWAPQQMDEETQSKLVLKLSYIWRNTSNYVEARLTKYGSQAVEQAAPFILSTSERDVQKAASWLAQCPDVTVESALQQVREPQEENRDWVPHWMDEREEKAFLTRLKKIWSKGDKFVNERLATYTPDIVTQCFHQIMADSETAQRDGAKLLVKLNKRDKVLKSFSSGQQQEQNIPPAEYQQQHTSQQAPYQGHPPHQEDLYGGQYGQQNPYGYDHSQYYSQGGSYNRHNDVD